MGSSPRGPSRAPDMKSVVIAVCLLSLVEVEGDKGAISAAVEKLNTQLQYLISSVEASVDPVIASIKSDCEQTRLQTQSYGWALLGGGSLDIAADWYGNSRNPADILGGENLIFPYGYYAGYGIGFGAPYLLPTYIGDCSFDCSAADFSAVVYQYGLSGGVAGQVIGTSKLHNFGLDAKQSLSCLMQQTGSSKAAARVESDIDNIVEAGNQIISLQGKL